MVSPMMGLSVHFLFFNQQRCPIFVHVLYIHTEYKTKTKQPDGRHKDEPIWTPQERLYMTSACKYVDEAFLYDGEKELYKFLKNNQDNIDVRMVGDDHKGHPFTGDDLDIRVIFNSRDHDYSTTNTIKEIIKQRS